jgi:hypothetical protein
MLLKMLKNKICFPENLLYYLLTKYIASTNLSRTPFACGRKRVGGFNWGNNENPSFEVVSHYFPEARYMF